MSNMTSIAELTSLVKDFTDNGFKFSVEVIMIIIVILLNLATIIWKKIRIYMKDIDEMKKTLNRLSSTEQDHQRKHAKEGKASSSQTSESSTE